MPLPAVIGAIGAIGASALSAGMNSDSSEAQRQWSERMIDRQNRYNSPVEQVKRLRKAGINPALAMDNGMMSSGQQSDLPSYDRPQYDFSPVGEALSQGIASSIEYQAVRSRSRLDDENAIAQRQRNVFGLQQAYIDLLDRIADMKQKGGNTKFLESQASYMQKQIEAFDRRNDAEVVKLEKESQKIEKDMLMQDLMISQQQIINKYLPQELRGKIRLQNAQVEHLLSAVALNDAEAAYKEAETIVSGLKKEGLEIDNQTKRDIADALVDDAYNKADESFWNSQEAAKEYHSGRVFGKMIPGEKYSTDDGSVHSRYYDRPSRGRNGRIKSAYEK